MLVFDPAEMFLWLLAAFRATGLLMILPLFIVRSVPMLMRVALALLLAWIVAPSALPPVPIPDTAVELVLVVAKELSIGLLMGLAVQLIIFTLELAAHILAMEIGLHPTPGFDPSANVAGNPVGTGLFYLALIMFLAGAQYAVLFAFARSFELVPPGLQTPDMGFVPVVIRHTARIFQLGVLMSAPVLAVNFLVNLAFSLLGRVVPKMNVFILSFSVRILAGSIMFTLSIGLVAHYLYNQFEGAPELMLQLLPFGGF